jgi:hypothetical protein
VQDVLLQVFSKSDEKALTLFANDPEGLLRQIESNEANLGKGMRWDELVLRIEWNCEVNSLLKRTDLNSK